MNKSEENSLTFEWSETGKLEVELFGNQHASLRYEPSESFVEDTLEKLRKKADKGSSLEKGKLTLVNQNTVISGDLAKVQSKDDTDINDTVFSKLSSVVRESMIKGCFDILADTYMLMSRILNEEEKYIDELKLLMLSFYLRLSGASESPKIDLEAIEQSKRVVELVQLRENSLKAIYFDVVSSDITPRHIMTVKGTYRLFEMLILGKTEKAKKILLNKNVSIEEIVAV